MPNRPGYRQTRASDCRDSQGRDRVGAIRTFGRPGRSACSVSGWRSSSSCPGRARLNSVAGWQRRCSARAAAVCAARQACRRTTAAAAWSRGRHQRAASRHRPGCRAAHQAGDACGSSRWALPARTTEIIETTLSSCLAGWRLLPAAGPFPRIEQRSCWPGKLRGAGTSGVVPKRVLASLHRPAAPAIASGTTPHLQGDVTAVPCSTSALARKRIVCSAMTR